MGSILRALIGMFIGTLMVRLFRALSGQNQINDTAQDLRRNSLDFKPCPTCGVYTSEPCLNPGCRRTI